MLQVEHQGVRSTIWLNYAPLNLLTYDRLQEIIKAHQTADLEPTTRVIVMRSRLPQIFSHGLDPESLLKKNEIERAAVFQGISELLYHMLGLKKPLIAAIEGDTFAGGAVLAATADFRLFHQEHGKLSFAEAKVGLAMPRALIQLISSFVSPGALREIVMMGKNLDASAAMQTGVANGVYEGAQFEKALTDWCNKLARLHPLVHEVNKERINKKARNMARKLIRSDQVYRPFMGAGLLEEGLKSVVEKRPAKF